MNRNQFIKTSIFGTLAVSIVSNFSFISIQDRYTRNQLIGKENPDITGDTYTSKMHKDAKVAFQEMKKEAAKDGITLEVVSAYRSFKKQKELFENKYQQFISEGLSPIEAINKIIEYSTIPGTSRHHWGTDIDIIDANFPRPESVLEEEHFYGEGPYCKLKEWMNVHSEKFGFYEVYSNNPNRKGFKYEPWHFSYAPVSKPMLQEYKKLDILKVFQEEKILGSEYFNSDFIDIYRSQNILDINPELL